MSPHGSILKRQNQNQLKINDLKRQNQNQFHIYNLSLPFLFIIIIFFFKNRPNH